MNTLTILFLPAPPSSSLFFCLMQILLGVRNCQSYVFCLRPERDQKIRQSFFHSFGKFTVALAESFSKTTLFSTTGNRNVRVHLVLVMRLNAHFIIETDFTYPQCILVNMSSEGINTVSSWRQAKETGGRQVSPPWCLHFAVRTTAKPVSLTSSKRVAHYLSVTISSLKSLLQRSC